MFAAIMAGLIIAAVLVAGVVAMSPPVALKVEAAMPFSCSYVTAGGIQPQVGYHFEATTSLHISIPAKQEELFSIHENQTHEIIRIINDGRWPSWIGPPPPRSGFLTQMTREIRWGISPPKIVTASATDQVVSHLTIRSGTNFYVLTENPSVPNTGPGSLNELFEKIKKYTVENGNVTR